MGAQVGNTRLAGDAAARLREEASRGIQMRREALKDKRWENEKPAHEQNRLGRPAHDQSQANRTSGSKFRGTNPAVTPATGGDNPGAFGGFDAPVVSLPTTPSAPANSEFSEQGSPAYAEAMERVRSLDAMRNTGSNF
jgi:hypothetical protein